MIIEKVAERIGQKDWIEVKNYWQNFLHMFDFPIDCENVFENIDDRLRIVAEEIKKVEDSSTIKDHYFQIDGIQTKIFHNAIILFYKSINALKSAQCDQIKGYKTWSINNYYQSSYFIVKSLLYLLGIFNYRSQSNVDILIDLLPQYKKISKRQFLNNRQTYECQIQIIKQLEHWQNWRILQKIINYLKNPPFDDSYNILFSMDPKSYAKHRNELIYHNEIWYFNDLKNELFDLNYGIMKIKELDFDTLPKEKTLTIILSFHLIHIAYTMFKDISSTSRNFQNEFDLMTYTLSNENNINYNKFIVVNY